MEEPSLLIPGQTLAEGVRTESLCVSKMISVSFVYPSAIGCDLPMTSMRITIWEFSYVWSLFICVMILCAEDLAPVRIVSPSTCDER